MPGAARPFSAFRFRVTFTGAGDRILDAGFTDVQGLESSIDVKAHPEGGVFQGNRQLLGRTTYQPITLKRGMTSNFELWVWFTNVSRGRHPVDRKEVVIELLDAGANSGAAVATWNVTRAVPIKLRASDLSGKSTDLAIEELQLAHEGLELKLPQGGP